MFDRTEDVENGKLVHEFEPPSPILRLSTRVAVNTDLFYPLV